MSKWVTVNGKPQGKQRPRWSSRVRCMYTPQATKAYEEVIALKYKVTDGTYYAQGTAVKISLQIFMSGSTEQKKPDIDNVVKSVLDGLNGVAYADDKQVVELVAKKNLCPKDTDHIEFLVERVDKS